MKKIILTFFAAVSLTTGFSQFTKGNILAGGSTNIGLNFQTEKFKSGSNTTTSLKSSSINFQPQGGYFIIDNLAVGAGIDFSSQKFKIDGSSNKDISSRFIFAPFGRYYFDKFYAQASVGLGSYKHEYNSGNTTTTNKQNITNWSIAGGYAILVNESITLEPQLGYESTTYKNGSNKDIHSGLFIRFGVYVYLNKK